MYVYENHELYPFFSQREKKIKHIIPIKTRITPDTTNITFQLKNIAARPARGFPKNDAKVNPRQQREA